MSNRFFIGLYLLLSGLLWAGCAIAGQPLSVEAMAKSTKSGPTLTFVVKNVSDKTVTLEEWRLPWGQRQSVIVVAADRRGGAPLKEATLIDDVFLPSKVSIKPGDTLRGDIDLIHYVSDIDKKVGTKELVLFWYYNAKGVSGPLGEYGGWLTIDRTGR